MDNEKVKQKRGRKSKLSQVIESQHTPENIIISTNEPILFDVTVYLLLKLILNGKL